MARRCCQRCPDFRGVPRAAGLRTGRTGFVPCGPGLVRLPHARVSTILPAPPHRPHRVNQPGSAAACITLAAFSTPIVATRIAHRSRGEWQAAVTRARRPRFLSPAPATCVPRRHKQAEPCSQLNAGIKMGPPNGDPIKKLFGFAGRLPDALQPLRRANELALSHLEELHQANELALSYLDHSTRQGFGSYVVGLSRNSFTVDLHATLVDHATSIARRLGKT